MEEEMHCYGINDKRIGQDSQVEAQTLNMQVIVTNRLTSGTAQILVSDILGCTSLGT